MWARAALVALLLTTGVVSTARAQASPRDRARALASPSLSPSLRTDASTDWRLILGVVMAGVGYAGAAAWGAHYQADLPLGVARCNDPYAAWQFVPFVGPAIGAGVALGCVPDGLTTGEYVVGFLTSALQIVGTALALVGGLSPPRARPSPDPAVQISLAATGASLVVRGTF